MSPQQRELVKNLKIDPLLEYVKGQVSWPLSVGQGICSSSTASTFPAMGYECSAWTPSTCSNFFRGWVAKKQPEDTNF